MVKLATRGIRVKADGQVVRYHFRGGSRIQEGGGGGFNLVPNSDTGGATNDDF